MADEYMPSVESLLQAHRDLYQALTAERNLLFIAVESDNYKKVAKTHDEKIKSAQSRASDFFSLTKSDIAKARRQEFFDLFQKWNNITQEIKRQRTEEGRNGRRTAMDMSYQSGIEAFEAIGEIFGLVHRFGHPQSRRFVQFTHS